MATRRTYTYTLTNTRTVKGSSTQVQPAVPQIILDWSASADALSVTLNGESTSDYTFNSSDNTLTFTGSFHKDDLPVVMAIRQDLAFTAPAYFASGAAIRAEDLNANFEHVLKLIEQLQNP